MKQCIKIVLTHNHPHLTQVFVDNLHFKPEPDTQDGLAKAIEELSAALDSAGVREIEVGVELRDNLTEVQHPRDIVTAAEFFIRKASGQIMPSKIGLESYALHQQLIDVLALIFWVHCCHYRAADIVSEMPACVLCDSLQPVRQMQVPGGTGMPIIGFSSQCRNVACYSHTLAKAIQTGYEIDSEIVKEYEKLSALLDIAETKITKQRNKHG